MGLRRRFFAFVGNGLEDGLPMFSALFNVFCVFCGLLLGHTM